MLDSRRRRAAVVGLALPLLVLGCNIDPTTGQTSSVEVQILNGPGVNALCARVTAQSTLSQEQLIDIGPDGRATFVLPDLPLGPAAFLAQGYGSACSAIGDTPPTSASSPQTIVIAQGAANNVSLLLASTAQCPAPDTAVGAGCLEENAQIASPDGTEVLECLTVDGCLVWTPFSS